MRIRRLLVPLIIITVILAVLNYFIYVIATLSLSEPQIWLMVVLAAGVVLMPGSLIISMTGLRKKLIYLIQAGYIWMGVFMIAFFFAVVESIVALIRPNINSQWILPATLIISLWSLRISFFGPKVVTHKLKGPDFLRGLRMVQISDLHVGMPTLTKKWLDGVTQKIEGANADLIVVTGDLADGAYDEVAPMLEPLRRLKAPKFYVTGNHEYIRGGDWEGCLRDLGFQVLHNTHQVINRPGGNLLIAGVPDRGVRNFKAQLTSSPDVALKTSQDVGYKILLAHEPSSVFDLKTEKCDLILAGHTHGGQIFPFRIFVRLQQPVAMGFKTIRGIRVFAHQGTGFWGPPMRWFTRCEIVVMEWC